MGKKGLLTNHIWNMWSIEINFSWDTLHSNKNTKILKKSIGLKERKIYAIKYI